VQKLYIREGAGCPFYLISHVVPHFLSTILEMIPFLLRPYDVLREAQKVNYQPSSRK
jgi:hypothetical protein